MPDPAVAALVLAAGESSRMGRPKALLDFGGETAIARMLRVLREAGVARIACVLSRRLAGLVHVDGVTIALNPDPARGQASTIRVGLANLDPALDAFLLCPVDVPLFAAADVRALLDAFASRQPGIEIVAPSDGRRRGHPVLFAKALRREFLALADGAPAHSVIRARPERVAHVLRANVELFSDLDTPGDYAAALARIMG